MALRNVGREVCEAVSPGRKTKKLKRTNIAESTSSKEYLSIARSLAVLYYIKLPQNIRFLLPVGLRHIGPQPYLQAVSLY